MGSWPVPSRRTFLLPLAGSSVIPVLQVGGPFIEAGLVRLREVPAPYHTTYTELARISGNPARLLGPRPQRLCA